MQRDEKEDLRNTPDRRSFSLLTVIKSISQPRRKARRRCDENPDTQSDWYHPRLLVLVLGILIMSAADAIFTLELIYNGAIEANPIMDYFLSISVPAFFSVKMILTSGCIILLTALSSYVFLKRFPITHMIRIIFIGYFLLISYEFFLLSTI